jgi:hypothetical protein
VHTRFSRCSTRRAITQAGAGRAATLADLMAVLRDHGTGTLVPHYSPLTGAMAAPCMHAGGTVASSQTTASWVAELTPGGGATHWVTATAAPCTGLFKPVRVTEPLDLGPAPTDEFDPGTLWWRHERLHRAALTDPAHLLPAIVAERDDIERRWLADPPSPVEAFAEAGALLERWTRDVELAVQRAGGRDTRPFWVRHYWEVRDERARMPDLMSFASAAGGEAGDRARA